MDIGETNDDDFKIVTAPERETERPQVDLPAPNPIEAPVEVPA